ncbi:MAG: sterol desaturase family protein [Pleurocapsa sp. MO_192.B19]|nr:sterol desaturase family protein [Pleurocapsa sp. MO_192.B19]
MINFRLKKLAVFFVQWLTFPVFILTTIYVMYSVQFYELSPVTMQMTIFVATISTVELLERWLPHKSKHSGGASSDRRLNFTSFVVLMTVVDPLLKVLSPLLLSQLVIVFGWPQGFTLFPVDWHFVPQLVLAALVAELGQYCMHRLGHVTWLWRFHSSHHSSSRMNWLTGFRVHPFNMMYHHLAGVFILMLIGINETVLFTYLALSGVLNIFQHANVRFKHGVLNYIFSTNELHRWHHSTQPRQANANYGALLIVWDLVFGSYYHKRHQFPAHLGLFSSKNYPVNSYWRQLIAPLFWQKWGID